MYNVTYTIDGNPYVFNLESGIVLRTGPDSVGGVRMAFQSYKEYELQNTEKVLPGLNLTHDQSFFFGYAQLHCQTISTESLLMLVTTGTPPGDLIVKATLKQTPEFAQAFNCPKGSPMVASEICKVF